MPSPADPVEPVGAVDPVDLAELARLIETATPRCGTVIVVAIDGGAAAGKSSLAAALGDLLPASVVLATDDLLEGWAGQFDFWTRLRHDVLAPLSQGRPAGYRRYDWHAGRFAELVACRCLGRCWSRGFRQSPPARSSARSGCSFRCRARSGKVAGSVGTGRCGRPGGAGSTTRTGSSRRIRCRPARWCCRPARWCCRLARFDAGRHGGVSVRRDSARARPGGR